MDFNSLFIWIVCFSCLFSLLIGIFASFKKNLGWLIINCLILLFTLGTIYFIPQWAGLISITIWSIFWLIPSWGFSRVNQLVYQQRYREARQFILWLRWLHPASGWLEELQIMTALEIAKQGQVTQAIKILKSFPKTDYKIQILPYFIKADWGNCLNWMQENIPQKVLLKDPNLLVYYLQALGETGKLNELLKTLETTNFSTEFFKNTLPFYLGRMYALAFCGQIIQVRQLFNTVLSTYPKSLQKFWLATAQIAAEKKAVARRELLSLRLENDWILSNAVQWRLCYLPVDPEKVLEPESLQILYQITTNLNQELRSREISFFKSKKAFATLFLITVNAVFFTLEIQQGGSENLETLYKFGALVPEEVFQGQWWRLITANFLHYGWVHFGTNMLGLFIVGRFVEAILGMGRFLVVYLVSGIGAMAIYTLIYLKIGEDYPILVGASAAIMGLIGCIFAISLEDFYLNKSSLATRRLQLIVLLIVLQFVFDLIAPDVSILSHFLGLIIGFLTSLVLIALKRINGS